MTNLNTHGIRLEYGKHKGELITRVPPSYLKWMVNEDAPMAEYAKAEIDRRGHKIPKVEISGHAIDRASLRTRGIWKNTSKRNEGLYSWLCRMTLEAIEHGEPVNKKIAYKEMLFAVTMGAEFPILKTIMRQKRGNDDDRRNENDHLQEHRPERHPNNGSCPPADQ